MTANVHSPVDRSCNNWFCCFRTQPDDVVEIQVQPPARPNSPEPTGPFELVRSVAMRQLRDTEVLSPTDLDIEFDAVHLKVHHTPHTTPEHSMHE